MKWRACGLPHDGVLILQVPGDARTRDDRSRVFSRLLPRLANKQYRVAVRKFYRKNLNEKYIRNEYVSFSLIMENSKNIQKWKFQQKKLFYLQIFILKISFNF